MMVKTSKPIVARVNGHAMGGGLGLVAASTLAIASCEATFGASEVKLGLFPFMVYAVLERLIPQRRLIEMVLCGEKLSAEAATQLGLVNRTVAPADLDAAVGSVTDCIKAAGPVAIELGPSAIQEVDDLEAMMHAIVDSFGDQLRQGLPDARATLRPGEVPT